MRDGRAGGSLANIDMGEMDMQIAGKIEKEKKCGVCV